MGLRGWRGEEEIEGVAFGQGELGGTCSEIEALGFSVGQSRIRHQRIYLRKAYK